MSHYHLDQENLVINTTLVKTNRYSTIRRRADFLLITNWNNLKLVGFILFVVGILLSIGWITKYVIPEDVTNAMKEILNLFLVVLVTGLIIYILYATRVPSIGRIRMEKQGIRIKLKRHRWETYLPQDITRIIRKDDRYFIHLNKKGSTVVYEPDISSLKSFTKVFHSLSREWNREIITEDSR